MFRHRCPKCKNDIEHTEKFNSATGKTRNKVPIYFPYKNIDGSLNWKNMFKVRIITVIIIFLILYSTWAYKKDMSICEEAQTNPCAFCETTGCITKVQISNTEVNGIAADKIKWIPEFPEETD